MTFQVPHKDLVLIEQVFIADAAQMSDMPFNLQPAVGGVVVLGRAEAVGAFGVLHQHLLAAAEWTQVAGENGIVIGSIRVTDLVFLLAASCRIV